SPQGAGPNRRRRRRRSRRGKFPRRGRRPRKPAPADRVRRLPFGKISLTGPSGKFPEGPSGKFSHSGASPMEQLGDLSGRRLSAIQGAALVKLAEATQGGNLAGAVRCAEVALVLIPDSEEVRGGAGIVFFMAGDFERACQVIPARPASSQYAAVRGRALLAL